MTTTPVDLNSDVPSRSWNDTRIEALEPRLAAAGITLPESPESPEMQGIYAQLSASDPDLMKELQNSMAAPLADGVHEKISSSADLAAKAKRVKGAPMRMVSGPNHKNRIQVDGKLLGWVAGGVLIAGAIAFVAFSPSSGEASSAATRQGPQGSGGAQAGQPTVAAGSSTGTAASGTAGTQPTTATGSTTGPLGAGGSTATPPLLSTQQVPPAIIQPVSAGNSVSAPVVAPDPVPVRSASPAPMPYVPQQIVAPPVSPARFSAPPRQTTNAPAVPARVPLMTLQPPAVRTEAPRRLVALSAPLQRANRVVQSTPVETQGAAVNPARRGLMASSVQVAPSRLTSSSTQAPVPAASGLVSQGQASAPPTALGQGMSQQTAPGAGRSGLIAMGAGAASETPARASQGLVSAAGNTGSDTARSSRGLVSAAGNTGSETALQGQGEAPGGRGGLISLASARSTSGLAGQAQGTPEAAPVAEAAPQGATVLGGAAPAPAVPESPYTMGRQIKAVTDTGALFASVVGNDSAGVINGEDAQLIYATAEDGSVWRGTPRLLTSGRVGVTFDRVLVKGQTMKVLADATDGTGLPGVLSESHTDTPKIASELFQAALSGARSFAQASLQGDSSITANGTIVSQAAKPNFWVTLGGALAGSLSLPSARVTQVNVTSLPKGTQILLVVRGEQ